METVFDFIRSQSDEFFDNLYGSDSHDNRDASWCCKAIFQSLPSLAKSYLMRIIFIDNHQFCADDLVYWLSTEYEDLNQLVINELSSMKIIKRKGNNHFFINPFFREYFLFSLCDCIPPWTHLDDQQILKNEPSLLKIESYCRDKWNSILKYLITSKNNDIHKTIQNFFIKSQLMAMGEDEHQNKRLMITAKGYEYILKDQQTQVIQIFGFPFNLFLKNL